jgi:hypothetical protein
MALLQSSKYTCDDNVSVFMIRQNVNAAIQAGNTLAESTTPSAPRGFRPRHFHLLNRTTGATQKLMVGQLPLVAPTLPSGYSVVGYTGEKSEGANGIDFINRLI